jgi:ubiquinone/menaquinone biosynthesis C-methylase UbiE
MKTTAGEASAKAAATYNAAADSYDDAPNSFWARFGRNTVDRLDLQSGQRVLDVCCGSGASALPAAEKVGPRGFVLGVDLSEKLLELARTKANEQQMH